MFHVTDHDYHLGSKWYLEHALNGHNLTDIRDGGRKLITDIIAGDRRTDGHYLEFAHSIRTNELVPGAIKSLNPESIAIDRDDVLYITLPVPRRVILLVFLDGRHQSGTEQLVDGVWYWNGRTHMP